MADKKTTTDKSVVARLESFDDQLWPINGMILALAASVATIVFATSRFDDPRFFHNGWVRLGSVAVMVVVLMLGVLWLQRRMLRRLQFCVLLSLLLHLGIAVYMHEAYLAIASIPEASDRESRKVETPFVMPDYNWQLVEQPEVLQAFESIVETDSPKQQEKPDETVPQQDLSRQPVAMEKPKTAEAEPSPQQPDKKELRRAELSAPRRAEEVGQLSRQLLKDRPAPDEPSPEAEATPAPKPSTQAAPSQIASVQRRAVESPKAKRQTVEPPPVRGEPSRNVPTPARAAVPQKTPETESPSRPSTLARAEKGVDVPSSVADAKTESVASPATVGDAAASRIEAVTKTAAVGRMETHAPLGNHVASAGVSDFALGAAQVEARTGQPRVSGREQPSVAVNAPTQRLARTLSGETEVAASPAELTPTPGAASSSGQSGPPAPVVAAQADVTSRRRLAASTTGRSASAAPSSADLGSVSGSIGASQLVRISRNEAAPSDVGGMAGSISSPARAGLAQSPAIEDAALATVTATPPGGGNTSMAPLQANAGRQKRQFAGLPGSQQTMPSSGAPTAFAQTGSALPTAAGRRASASETHNAGNDASPGVSTTLARSATGTDLPADAAVLESGSSPGGTGGMAMSPGSLPSSLEAGANTSIQHGVGTRAPSSGRPSVYDGNATNGPAAPPGLSTGPRRVLSGNDRIAAIATLWGGALVRSPNAAGELSGTAESAPEVAAATPGKTTVAGTQPGIGELVHRSGGLPVQVAAASGPGGLGSEPSLDVGIRSHRARPESEVVHTASRRFLLERSGGTMAIDGVVSEPMEAFQQRGAGGRRKGAKAGGGSEGTEIAVERGLDFFARMQFPDGHWSLHAMPPGVKLDEPALGQMESDTAATGLVLLTYLGGGYTHLDDKHRIVVRKGVDWLIQHQKSNGDLFSGGSKYTWFYSHGIASMALCEAFGMTQDPELRNPAYKAIDFIIKSQHPTYGGWRYEVRPDTGQATESDTSVTGWQLMALKSAQMAGLEVPSETFRKINGWLDYAAASSADGRYVYNPNANPTPEQQHGREASLAMTAEAMLMRMYLGRTREDPRLIEGAEYLKANLPADGTPETPLRNCYYWYYATQVMFQMQGSYWTAWNERFRPLLQNSQTPTGDLAGSWDPSKPVPDRWGAAAGRMYVTAMHLLMLEVYYRHLPLFRLD